MILNIEKTKLEYTTAVELAAVASDALSRINYKTPKPPMSKIVDKGFIAELRACLSVDTDRQIRFFNAVINFAVEEQRITEEEMRQHILQNRVPVDFFTRLLDGLCYKTE